MPASYGNQCIVQAARTKVLDVVPPASVPIAGIVFSSNNDTTWEVFFDKDVSDFTAPELSLSVNSSGGFLPKGFKPNLRLTMLSIDPLSGATIESPPSDGVNFKETTGSTPTNKLTASWSSHASAVGWRIYGGSYPGRETLMAELPAATLSYVITETSAIYDGFQGVATNPDIVSYALKGHNTLTLTGISANVRMIVFATASSNGTKIGLTLETP